MNIPPDPGFDRSELETLCCSNDISFTSGSTITELRRLLAQKRMNLKNTHKFGQLAKRLDIDGWERATSTAVLLSLIYNFLYGWLEENGYIGEPEQAKHSLWGGVKYWAIGRAQHNQRQVAMAHMRVDGQRIRSNYDIVNLVVQIDEPTSQIPEIVRTWRAEFQS